MQRKLFSCDNFNNLHSVEGVSCIYETSERFPSRKYPFGVGHSRRPNTVLGGGGGVDIPVPKYPFGDGHSRAQIPFWGWTFPCPNTLLGVDIPVPKYPFGGGHSSGQRLGFLVFYACSRVKNEAEIDPNIPEGLIGLYPGGRSMTPSHECKLTLLYSEKQLCKEVTFDEFKKE